MLVAAFTAATVASNVALPVSVKTHTLNEIVVAPDISSESDWPPHTSGNAKRRAAPPRREDSRTDRACRTRTARTPLRRRK